MKNPSHILYAFDNPVGLKSMLLYCKAHKKAVLSIQGFVTWNNTTENNARIFRLCLVKILIHLQQYRRKLLFSIMLCHVQNG
jgi:hypothetical protein